MATGNQFDLLLKSGHVIDPLNGIDEVRDVAISNGRIAAVEAGIDPGQAAQTADLSGRYVTPGLLDIHVHVYHTREPEGISVMADSHSFRSGVTTMVDTGTSGALNFLHFRRTVIDLAETRILAFVNIVDLGMIGDFEQDIRHMDPELAASVVLAYPEVCVGVKTAHYWTRDPWDAEHPPWAAVDRAVEAGDICGKPVMVDFWPRPPARSYEQLILDKMRPGDIHTHVFAQQFPVLNEGGRPSAFLHEARSRGIIFDLGHGAGSFWFRNAVPAMQNGFSPDSISTDLHIGNIHGAVVDMQTTMSKLLNIGMPLREVILRSTVTPAREINRPELGHLSIGAEADVAVFALLHGDFAFVDCGNAKMRGDRKLECAMTVRAGKIVFDPGGLSMPAWEDAPAAYWQIRQ